MQSDLRGETVMTNINTASANHGRELFHAIWQKVQERFYDQDRLLSLDWAAQKHRFDAQIVDEKSALICARELLAGIGDSYTRLLDAVEVTEKRERRIDTSLHARNKTLPGNIGYIGIGSFDHSEIVEQVRERLEGIAGCEAFIVDLRGNSGGLINKTANVLELFIDGRRAWFHCLANTRWPVRNLCASQSSILRIVCRRRR